MGVPLSAASARAWQAFRDRVAELGGTVVEPEWLGSGRYHRVRCAEGHDGKARPNTVQQGGRIRCACPPKLNLHSSPGSHLNQRRTAVYRLYDANDHLLYVGVTTQLKQRMRDHAGSKFWWHLVARRDVQWFDTRPEAEAVEGTAIRDERPRYNATARMGVGWQEVPRLKDPFFDPLMARLKSGLADGTYPPGYCFVQSTKEAAPHNVSVSTWGHVLYKLKEEGLLLPVRGPGTKYVVPDVEPAGQPPSGEGRSNNRRFLV